MEWERMMVVNWFEKVSTTSVGWIVAFRVGEELFGRGWLA